MSEVVHVAVKDKREQGPSPPTPPSIHLAKKTRRKKKKVRIENRIFREKARHGDLMAKTEIRRREGEKKKKKTICRYRCIPRGGEVKGKGKEMECIVVGEVYLLL